LRNRWFHRPLLHSPLLRGEKKPSWLELFFDLIFVAAFIQLGNGLSHHVTLEGAIGFGAVFLPLWVAWTGFTFFQNRFTIDDFTHRLVVFGQMFAVGAMGIAAPSVLDGETRVFSFASAVAHLMVAIMYLRAMRQVDEASDFGRYWGWVFFGSAAVWAVAGFVPAPYTWALWAVAILSVLAAPLSKHSRALSDRYPTDFEHLGERYGLLTIIVLGESFVKVLSSLIEANAGIDVYLQSGIVLLITCSIWWIYFDDVAGSHIRHERGGWIVWLYAHIPLQIAVTAVGVAVKKAVEFDFQEPAPAKYRWLLGAALASVFFAVAIIDSVTERRQAELSDRARINARVMSGMLMLALAPAGVGMSGGAFLLVVTALCLSQVLFDMMMAPFEAAEHDEIGQRPTAELDREAVEKGKALASRRRWDVMDSVRKGTPSNLRRDLYFYLMEGSWTRLFVVFGFLYLVGNVFFAALFVIQPGCISNVRPDSFLDAFFFSVETMSTIGYGTMSPVTDYGHALVTVEAAIGLLGVALATGVMFAKASRPSAGVLFSNPIVLTRMHGKRVLAFRVGNARGNEVVDATMNVTAVVQEVTPEGHHMRRLRDLKLERNRTPLFALTWHVMHPVDDDSPLADVDFDHFDRHVFSIVVTLIGHDATYGQTVYSRHTYHPDDLHVGARFVDVISELQDGRLMVDYAHFHDVVPDEQAAGGAQAAQ
jgi:inward rectifier potassium channel